MTLKVPPAVLGHPLPHGWPRPLLPFGALLDVSLPSADPKLLSAALKAAAAEPEDGEAPTSKEAPRKSRKRQRGKEAGWVCSCGVIDESKFMLACDGCDQWFHGPRWPAASHSRRAHISCLLLFSSSSVCPPALSRGRGGACHLAPIHAASDRCSPPARAQANASASVRSRSAAASSGSVSRAGGVGRNRKTYGYVMTRTQPHVTQSIHPPSRLL